jgi:3-hydroxyisobutyrate dehydrogenase-like beta-hydroxyacid dehydrogenase
MTHTPATPPRDARVGLLYPGEMGTAVANLLRHDHRVVTTLAGRGAGTARNCRGAGLEELDGLREVVRYASVLLVLVPPAAALRVAEQVRAELPARGERLVYVDLNSVSPETVRNAAAVFAGTPVDFVDGAISGPASRLAAGCTLYLSGARAGEVAALFEGRMTVRVLGDAPGQASALRMLLSVLTKGVIALFVELALAARQAGILDRTLAAYRASYPGILEVVERTLPTYPVHAGRRAQEMAEVEDTLSHLGLCPTVVRGVRLATEAVAQCPLPGDQGQAWTVPEVVEALHARGVLKAHPESPGAGTTKPSRP